MVKRWCPHVRMLLLVAVLLPFLTIDGAIARAPSSTKLYIGHASRFSAQIPVEWSVDPSGRYDYAGADGFVANQPLSGATLDEACSTFAESPLRTGDVTVSESSWSGKPACRVDGEYSGDVVAALIVPIPSPFALQDATYSFAALITDPVHFSSIANSISFSFDRVSPEAYVLSVIDLLKVRAYWSTSVDWDKIQETALSNITFVPSMAMAQAVLGDLLQALRNAGDTHSYLLRPTQYELFSAGDGYGFLLADDRVVTVYDDGPAAADDLRVGDLIQSVNGDPVEPSSFVADPYDRWMQESITLAIRREGVTAPISRTIQAGDYTRYVAPSGRRLDSGLGYIAVPGFTVHERRQDFVDVADSLLDAIDRESTCGWIVDLRLDNGGNYSLMVSAIGPILGNGTFVGWESAQGDRRWVSYDDGVIRDDGIIISDYLAGNTHSLRVPSPPVAVLSGPLTGSAGEVTTLAFVDRPNTRLFGDKTSGTSTAIMGFPLFDGTVFGLAMSAMIDRTGVTHLDGVVPDVEVATNWETFGTDADPVIAAAQQWLNDQNGCAGNASPIAG